MDIFINYKDIEKNVNVIIQDGYVIKESYCINPVCTCETVLLTFSRIENNKMINCLEVDLLFNKLVYDNVELIEENIQYFESIMNEIIHNENFISRFKEHYMKAKIFGLSNAHQAFDKNIVKQVIENKKIIGYSLLFSNENITVIQYKNKSYYLYDSYCPDPNCHCNNTLFSFLTIEPNKHQETLVVRWMFETDDFNIIDKICSKDQALSMINQLKALPLDIYKTHYQNMKDYGLSVMDIIEDDEYIIFDKPIQMKEYLSKMSLSHLKASWKLIAGKTINFSKAKLIKYIDEEYVHYLDILLLNFHKEILDSIFNLTNHKDESELDDEEVTHIYFLINYLFAFMVDDDDETYIHMADKVKEKLTSINKEELYEKVSQNDVIVFYARRLNEIYGIYPYSLLSVYLKTYEEIEINFSQLLTILQHDSNFTKLYQIKDEYIVNNMIDSIENFTELLEQNKTLKYAIITKEELKETNPNHAFLSFLKKELKMKFPEDFYEYLLELIKKEEEIDEIYELTHVSNITNSQRKLLKKKISTLYLNTRRFSLKGYTLNEIQSQSQLIKFNKK